MLPNIFILCLLFLPLTTHAVTSNASDLLPSFETTWLESTAGAGVGSLLLDESTILNPAPLAFFNLSSLYFQKTQNKGPSSSGQTAFIISDTGKGIPASFSYITTERDKHNKRTRYAVSLAYPIKRRSAIGFGYRLIKDERSTEQGHREKHQYKQLILGMTHIPVPSLSVGLVLLNPFQEDNQRSRATIGIQYVYQNFFTLLFDIESALTSNFSGFITYKPALQLKIMSDLFFRIGFFQNNELGEKGMGTGIGWIQPRLSVNLGVKNTRIPSEPEKNVKTSFSVSYRF